jgi:NhaP-type Na+/H+ or K+/H+ antiporter
MTEQKFILIGAGLAAVVLLILARNPGAAGSLGQGLGEAVGQAAGGAVAGVALGVGDSIGLPRTDKTECEKAMAEGRYWDASFVCPAGDFIGGAAGDAATSVKTTLSDLWDKL